MLWFFVFLFVSAFFTGMVVAWIFQSLTRAIAYFTALYVLSLVASLMWKVEVMRWAIAGTATALYAFAVGGAVAWWALRQYLRQVTSP